MGIRGGFGTTIDFELGTMRQWVSGPDGVKRWADSGEPVPAAEPKYHEMQSALEIIYTWSSVDGGLVPEHVKALAGKALRLLP